VPTVIESGYPGFEAVAWHAVLAPAKTSPEIIQKLNTEIAIVLSDPELQKRLSQDGIEIIGSSAEDFSTYIKNEVAKWAKVVRDANIKLD
jgi:tripartite-type tricarboxylate transporter receptor subunit TctC